MILVPVASLVRILVPVLTIIPLRPSVYFYTDLKFLNSQDFEDHLVGCGKAVANKNSMSFASDSAETVAPTDKGVDSVERSPQRDDSDSDSLPGSGSSSHLGYSQLSRIH